MNKISKGILLQILFVTCSSTSAFFLDLLKRHSSSIKMKFNFKWLGTDYNGIQNVFESDTKDGILQG